MKAVMAQVADMAKSLDTYRRVRGMAIEAIRQGDKEVRPVRIRNLST